MALISRKKKPVALDDRLRGYLSKHGRMKSLPIDFDLLSRFTETVTHYNKKGEDTLWHTVGMEGTDRLQCMCALIGHVQAGTRIDEAQLAKRTVADTIL